MGKYKTENGTSRVGDFLRSIKKSDVLGNVIDAGGEIISGDYVGAFQAIIGAKDKGELSTSDAQELVKRIEADRQDRQGAREMNIVAMNQSDVFVKRFVPILGGSVVLMLFLVIWGLFFVRIPPENKETLTLVLGALLTSATAVIAFYFGSTQGSKDKTNIFKRFMK